MPVLFACPHCNSETVVDDAYVGLSGPCATCGRLVTVPEQTGRRATVIDRAAGVGLNLGNLGMLIGVIIGSLAIGALVIGLSVSIIGPAVQAAHAKSLKQKSAENLQLIAQAMQQYHAQHGSYPPAYTVDAKGKRMHSWRVLLLPFLGERALYQQYDMTQSWDGPTNSMLVTRMPAVYASPGDDNAKTTFETSYVVVVGRNTIFPGATAMTMDKVTDGLANTLLVVESTESGINWMEPKDLDASKMNYGINSGPTNCIRSYHPYGAQAVFADTRTHFLTDDLPSEYIEALTTAANADHAPLDALGQE